MNADSKQNLQISLVIPLKNEAASLETLIASIKRQTFPPAEIILVDGGSTDGTAELSERLTANDARYRVVRASDATPGRGRNVGVENARHDWIAFTDAGIKLSDDWLEKLVARVVSRDPEADIVYGNYAPLTGSFFEKCAALTYVAPQPADGIRGKFIASSLVKKSVWEAVGGFPDWRAAEDLAFMEAAEKRGFRAAFAPGAFVYWHLRPDLSSTFRKFVLYSKHNVWAGRQWDWHHGIAKQYLLLAPFLLLAFFHSYWWLLLIPLWLFARTAKRILAHRYEFGLIPLFNPLTFFGAAFLTLVIDLAAFIGWAQAIFRKNG